jgi:intein/homing endonuclease
LHIGAVCGAILQFMNYFVEKNTFVKNDKFRKVIILQVYKAAVACSTYDYFLALDKNKDCFNKLKYFEKLYIKTLEEDEDEEESELKNIYEDDEKDIYEHDEIDEKGEEMKDVDKNPDIQEALEGGLHTFLCEIFPVILCVLMFNLIFFCRW